MLPIEQVAIIGMGYVGIPLAKYIVESGITCIGLDIDPVRIDQLNKGQSPLSHMSNDTIQILCDQGLEPTTDYSKVQDCQVIAICVPTPLTANRDPDLSFVTQTMEQLIPFLQKDQIIILESTTWPGTTQEVLAPMLEAARFYPGQNIHLVYSPEREDPGNSTYNTKTIPKIVGADFEVSLSMGVAFYQRFIDTVIPIRSTRAAEMVKLVENIHRSVNIGLVNELKILANKMDIDIFDVIDAAATKPFGFTKYMPGPGVGGHCIPIDPFYLTWKAREYGLHTRFIELAGEVNSVMPQYVVDCLIEQLNKQGKALKNAAILCIGIAYKPDVNDARESPSVMVMEILRKWEADIHYHDPFFPVFPKMREHKFDLAHEDINPEMISGMDAVLILTQHSDVNYDMIHAHANLIIDTRGVYRDDPRNIVFRA